jgi:hypothetical protein
VEHRGVRVPSVIRVPAILGGLNFLLRPLYKVIAEDVRDGVSAQTARRIVQGFR